MTKKLDSQRKVKAPPKNKKGDDNFLVVGIGASAGGIKALKEFFENIPADTGMAFVVILHLSPDYESRLAEILQAAASIPVKQVRRRVKVQPNCVYVIPPDKSLKINDGVLSLSEIERVEERRAPVDVFFRTLAQSHGSRAVAVVLSGTGPNGSMGVKHIKERNGICIVQDPQEAEYSDMPHNSIATGLVDYALPVAEIPAKIIGYKKNLGQVQIPIESFERAEVHEQALREIFTLLRIRTKHDFSNYKRATVLRRIERRINVHELKDLHSYAEYTREHKDETDALLRDLLISVTNFFRDKEAFENLEKNVIPKLFKDKGPHDQLRVWSAGCATGEEAYSLAMLLSDFAGNSIDAPKLQVFATDIDENAVAAAREGFYTNSEIADVSNERLDRYFIKEQNGYRVRREIREMVLFAPHNILKDPPFSRLDLVSCRNLLIYLNRSAQQRLMEIFHFALKPGGYLFLGSSESATESNKLYLTVDKSFNIFQARAVETHLPVPLSNSLYVPPIGENIKENQIPENRTLERLSYLDIHQRLLEEYAAPSVVVNEEYDIVHSSETAGRFMRLAGGEPSHNLLKIVHPELRSELRTALYQATQHQKSVETNFITINLNEQKETVKISVRPVSRSTEATRGLILVVFNTVSELAETALSETLNNAEPINQRLEDELVHAKSQLRATIEQYELQTEELKASNEELQAINEELHSAAEELETSKEELQSVNEELTTVNQELKVKIEELSQANNDLQNLITSTDIGTLFLDHQLRVKFFTPRALEIFNLIPADIGRPLSDITAKIENADLMADIEQVLAKLSSIEREIGTKAERWYLVKILPYRTQDDRIDGVIITFLEITKRKKQEQELIEMSDEMKHQALIFNTALSNITDLTYILDREGKFIYGNQPLLNLLNVTAEELIGKKFGDFSDSESLVKKLENQINQVFETGEIIRDETLYVAPDGSPRFHEYIFSPMINNESTVKFLVGSSRDITERRTAEMRLRWSEERLRLLIESATDYAIFTIREDSTIDGWNPGAERIFGYSESEIIGKNFEILFTPEDREQNVPSKEIKTAIKKGRADDERWHLRKDQTRFFASGVIAPLADGHGFVKIARDETSKMLVQAALLEKEMLRKLVSAQEDERRRIASDIHDNLGQQLTVLRLKLEFLKGMSRDNVELFDQIVETQEIAEQIDTDVDFLASELRPASLDDIGLQQTLSNFVEEWSKHTGIHAEFHSSSLSELRLDREIENNLYRISQEALNNIYKHANAENVSVLLEKRNNKIVLIIEDDGIGFDTEKLENQESRGLGLIGMQERAAICGGACELESSPGEGTTIYISVPERYANIKD